MGMGDETRSIVFLREIGPVLNSFGWFIYRKYWMLGHLVRLMLLSWKWKWIFLHWVFLKMWNLQWTQVTLPCGLSWIADYFSPNDLDVLVHINAKEARPFRIGIQGSVTTSGNDAGIVLSMCRKLPIGGFCWLSQCIGFCWYFEFTYSVWRNASKYILQCELWDTKGVSWL